MTNTTDGPRRRVTQNDVALKCGVSRVAVAVVLGNQQSRTTKVSEQTAKRIREAAQELGYRPNLVARQLAGSRSGVFGMLVSAANARYDYSRIGRLITQIEAQAYEDGYRLIVGHFGAVEHLKAYLDDFEDRGLEGLICLQHEITGADPHLIPKAMSRFAKVVYLNRPAGVVDPWHVSIDYGAGIREAVAHLHSRGRRRIGIAYYSFRNEIMRRRRQGWADGLQEVGLAFDESLQWEGPMQVEPHPELIDDVIYRLVVQAKADAILASNDRWAMALTRRLSDRRFRVPQDVAIVGYNNVDFAGFLQPSLTTIDMNDHDVGTALAVALRDSIRGVPKPTEPVAVPTKLVVRESG